MYSFSQMITMKCPSCGHDNDFDQPYAIHAGFSNQGFLYNEHGNRTLVWSSFDPAYEAIAGRKHPWTLTIKEQQHLESALRPAPSGGSWKFSNPARCTKCSAAISEPITKTIYYLLYPGSVDADPGPLERRLKEYLLQR
jgi:hypothetical protein